MHVQFVGSGDAFGSGGRFNTCIRIAGDRCQFLIDCGATSVVALKRQGIDLNAIEMVLVTHFHADHFGGLPSFILEAHLLSKRTAPLMIVGPRGLRKNYAALTDAMFPGSSNMTTRFPVEFAEATPGILQRFGSVLVHSFEVSHGNIGGPYLAYRLELEGRIIAYTGDTEWTDVLLDVGQNADLFIAEAYFFDKPVKLHLDYKTLKANLPRIAARRVVLTHMSDDMLAHRSEVQEICAEDGMLIEL